MAASVVVERSGPFVGALIASLPTAGGAAMIILAWQHPPAFIAQSAVGSMVANAAVAVFTLTYAALAQRRSLAVSIGAAFLVWLGVAFVSRLIEWNAATATLLNAVVYPIAIVAGSRFRAEGAIKRVAFTARRSRVARRRGDALRHHRYHGVELDRFLFLRGVCLLPGGDGLVLRYLASAHWRPGGRERRWARTHPADRPGPRPHRRAFPGRAGRRLVVLRSGPEHRHRLERDAVAHALAPARRLNQIRSRYKQEQRVKRGRQCIVMQFGFVSASLLLAAVLTAGPASAYDAYDQHNCNGVDWDDKRALVVSKVIAKPRVHFIKSPYDDDFKAESCPADTEACRKTAYLVTGDMVLTGKTRDAFTCVVYQSLRAKKQVWTRGWLPSTALAAGEARSQRRRRQIGSAPGRIRAATS